MHEASILIASDSQGFSFDRRFDACQVDETILGLGNDLLCQDEYVTVLQLDVFFVQTRRNEPRQIVPGFDQGETLRCN